MNDEWITPPDVYLLLNKRFKFMTDPCTTADNPLGAPHYFTKETDGLIHRWITPAFMNPPYSRRQIGDWVKKAYLESIRGVLVVGLLRMDPSTQWWQEWVAPHAWVHPWHHRITFVGAKSAYPFPSCIAVWHGL